MTGRVSRIAESPGAAGPVLAAVMGEADLRRTPDPVTGDLPTWRDFAACAEVDGELFFPEKGGSTREAKAVCAACPVAEPCLEYALERDERFGIYGGKSERERRRIKQERSRQQREAEAA